MKILIIGAGGIGSYLLRELYQLYINSVKGTEDMELMVVDGDEVEEKNIRYQDYPEIEYLGQPKAKVINDRYEFAYEVKFIEKDEELKGYEMIVLCVDNGKIRDLVYKHCDKNNKYFIDLRSEGRALTTYTKEYMDKVGLEKLQETYDVEKPPTSCQLKFELDDGKIQLGNRVVAMIGLQLLINHLRDEKNIDKITMRV